MIVMGLGPRTSDLGWDASRPAPGPGARGPEPVRRTHG